MLEKLHNQLQELQNFINEDYVLIGEGYKFNVLEEQIDQGDYMDNFILLQICDEDSGNLLENYRTDIIYNTLEENIMSLIKDIYKTEINYRKHYVNLWNSFCSRKISSLEKWFRKGNMQKVNEINKELVDRLKETNDEKYNISYYKCFVHLLYRAKDALCPKEVA